MSVNALRRPQTGTELSRGQTAIENRKAVKSAQRQAEAEQRGEAEHRRLIAEVDAAKQKVVEAQQQIAELRAAKEKAAEGEAAKHEDPPSTLGRQREETVGLRQEAEQRARSQDREDTERPVRAEQRGEAEHRRLIAEIEEAKQKAAEAQQQLADLRAEQEKAAKEEAAKQREVQNALDRQREETASLRQETEQHATSQDRQATQQAVHLQQLNLTQQRDRVTAQAQNEMTGRRVDRIEGLLGAVILPVTEQADDWILRIAAIPIQQQKFCRIIDQFHDDLEQMRQANNEIRLNMLYRDRKKDLEALLPNGAFENWLVNVKGVSQAADGSAAIVLQPPCRVVLASDACEKNRSKIRATIRPGTPPFHELEKVSRGDFVAVSGKILYAAEEEAAQELPRYALYKPGEYCSENDGVKEQETFVTEINYLVLLR